MLGAWIILVPLHSPPKSGRDKRLVVGGLDESKLMHVKFLSPYHKVRDKIALLIRLEQLVCEPRACSYPCSPARFKD